jgi:SAM-dependent methyltransferase
MLSMTDQLRRRAFDEVVFQFAPGAILFTALRLGLFSLLDGGAMGARRIATVSGSSRRGLEPMLACLVKLGFLRQGSGGYRLSGLSRRYFAPRAPHNLGKLFIHYDKLLKLWIDLPKAVKTGRPVLSILTADEKKRWDVDLVEGLFHSHRFYAWKLAGVFERRLGWRPRAAPPSILDVAAGSAVWSIPFALQWRDARITAVDSAPVLAVARRYVDRYRVGRRYRFLAGDIRTVDFGRDEYDVILLGHICHSEGKRWSRSLVKKCSRALKRSGKLLIMDYLREKSRPGAALPLVMALNALLGTEEGETFTLAEYRRWLKEAGLAHVKPIQLDGHSPVIVGRKP